MAILNNLSNVNHAEKFIEYVTNDLSYKHTASTVDFFAHYLKIFHDKNLGRSFLVKEIEAKNPSYSDVIAFFEEMNPFVARKVFTELLYEKIGLELFVFEMQEKNFMRLDTVVQNAKSTKKLVESIYKPCGTDLVNEQNFKESEGVSYIFAHRFGADTLRNVRTNLDSLLIEFYPKNKEKLSHHENRLFLALKELNEVLMSVSINSDILDIQKKYNTLKSRNVDYAKVIYDAMNIAKRVVADQYLKSCTNLESFKMVEDGDVKVYQCGKEPFRMFVSVTLAKRKGLSGFKPLSSRNFDSLSCSYVSESSLLTYRDAMRYVCLGYSKFDPKIVMNINKYDNFNEYKLGNLVGFRLANSFISPDEMLKYSRRTKNYNEFNFLVPSDRKEVENRFGPEFFPDERYMKPTCIFALNEITDVEKKFAQESGLPIFYVENEQYACSKIADERVVDYDFSL